MVAILIGVTPRRSRTADRSPSSPGGAATGDGRFEADAINVAPGNATSSGRPASGKWILHCHIAHHTINNSVEENGGGAG